MFWRGGTRLRILGAASGIGIVGACGYLRERWLSDAAAVGTSLDAQPEDAKSRARCKPAKVLPLVNERDYKLDLSMKLSDASGSEVTMKSLSLNDVKRYPRHSIRSSIPCQNEPPAQPGDTSRVATWTGAQLRDLVQDLVREFPNDMKMIEDDGEVSFECLDKTSSSSSSSIRFDQAVDPKFEALLAYEADGADITPSHGYPIRLVVPQLPGRKNVKWLSKIVFSSSQQGPAT